MNTQAPMASSECQVLFITSDFPPLLGTNTQRIASFTRHLPALGWRSSVITQAIEDLDTIDNNDLKELPTDINILRIKNPDPFAVRRRHLGKRPVHASESSDATPQDPPAQKITNSGLRSLFRTISSNTLMWIMRWLAYHPDTMGPWARYAAYAALKRDWHQCHHVVVSSSPSYSSHLAGLKIKKATGLPWIADFRDLWVGRPYRPIRSKWHEWINRKLEAEVVAKCDRLIIASPAWQKYFVDHYGDGIEAKLACITNGYEGAVYEKLREASILKPFGRKFVLTGSMHEAESPLCFLEALALLNKSHPELLVGFEAIFIGNAGNHLSGLQSAAQRTGIGKQIKFFPPRAHGDCVKAQFDADFLLMFSAFGHEDTIRGKSYEYLATGKPLLACIPPQGAQADLLKPAGTALIVPYGDVNATIAALTELLSGRIDHLQPNWPWIHKFDRANLARQLVDLLNDTAKVPPC